MNKLLYQKKHLFKQIAEGDEKAFREIFHSCNAQLYPFVLKLTRSESVAEDMVQETFLSLWQHRESVGKMDKPLSWLFTVASNKSLSWLRSHAAEVKRLQRIELRDKTTKEYLLEDLSAKEVQIVISQAVDLLPSKRQEIYKLSRDKGLSHKEIAEQLKISPNTIKNQLVSALRFIREYLTNVGGITIPIVIFFFQNSLLEGFPVSQIVNL